MEEMKSRLKKLRTDKKKTQVDLAEYLGITRQGYGNYEKGTTEPDNNTLLRLAEYFDVSIDFLLGRAAINHSSSMSEGRAYYGGGNDWTDEERQLAQAAVDDWRKRKKEMENKLQQNDGK